MDGSPGPGEGRKPPSTDRAVTSPTHSPERPEQTAQNQPPPARPLSRALSQTSVGSPHGSEASGVSGLPNVHQRASFSGKKPLPSIGLQSQGEGELEDFASVTESELVGKPAWSDAESDAPPRSERSRRRARKSLTSAHSEVAGSDRRNARTQTTDLDFHEIMQFLSTLQQDSLPQKLKHYVSTYFNELEMRAKTRAEDADGFDPSSDVANIVICTAMFTRKCRHYILGQNYLTAHLSGGSRSRPGSEFGRDGGQTAKSQPSAQEPEATVTTDVLFPYREEEFGVPIFELSDSDSESDGDGELVPRQSSSRVLPNVGPPQILQYVREGDREREGSAMTVISEEKSETADQPDTKLTFTGNCDFCSKKIKPFPTLHQQQFLPAEELYCCQEFAEYVRLSVLTPPPNSHLIDINPHPHYGGKKQRSLALRKAQERAQQRELEKQLAATTTVIATASATQPSGNVGGPAPGANTFAFTRAMKTINFQMSSQKCHDEGWVTKPATPPAPEEAMPDPFIIEPVDWMSHSDVTEDGEGEGPFEAHKQKQAQGPLHRFYEDGSKFLTIFPDGSGSVFYPSGGLAISVSSVEKGHFTYVVYDMPDKESPNTVSTLAVFQPTAVGGTYFSENSKLRMYYDQLGGVELSMSGVQKKKWNWLDTVTHNHAPPFQPVCFALNKYIGIRVLAQDNISMSFLCQERSCRFNVGVKLKLVHPEHLPGDRINEDLLSMAEQGVRMNELIDKMSNLLRLPKSVKADKIPAPYFLLSQQNRVEKKKKRLEKLKAEQKHKKERKNMRSLVGPGSDSGADHYTSSRKVPVVVVS